MFQTPVGHLRKKTVRRFPLTTTDWNQCFPLITAPANAWGMGEASLNLVDLIGGKDFTTTTATVVFRNTADPLRPYGVQCSTITGRITTASPSTDFDDPGTSFTWFIRCKMGASASSRIILGKKGTSSGLDGWRLGSNISGGLINFFDSAGAAGTTLATTANHNDGNFHDVMIVYDRSGANTAYLHTDIESVSVSMGAHTSFSNAANFGIGDANNASAGNLPIVSYLAYWPSSALSAANFTTIRSLS